MVELTASSKHTFTLYICGGFYMFNGVFFFFAIIWAFSVSVHLNDCAGTVTIELSNALNEVKTVTAGIKKMYLSKKCDPFNDN